jgi:hypothetical protein
MRFSSGGMEYEYYQGLGLGRGVWTSGKEEQENTALVTARDIKSIYQRDSYFNICD